ncbi:MAG: methionyl-tRNA formyltransferase [Parcubacteria group bacterium Gr01-1014_56]|nr:MAG: methionyl-tRNA formyltransferase [Parcubacteria group bacterium Gr01-1014_56]
MSPSKKPLFAFFGTPHFGVVVLNALEKNGLLPALVITAPDKPRGRGQALSPSPTKEWALARGIDVLTPTTLKDEQFVAELGNSDWDVFVVAAYGSLIPKTILDIPRCGSLNVHPSLLPKFRGPSPALSAILRDERVTGVTIMQMNEKMDAGPVVAQAKVELLPAQAGEEEAPGRSGWPPKGAMFEDLLATEGGNLLAEILPEWLAGKVTPEPQDEKAATYTRKFTDQDALVDLAGDARAQLLKIRAFDHGPRAYFMTPDGKRVIITDAEIREGKLEILKVIPEGKKEIPFKTYLESRE